MLGRTENAPVEYVEMVYRREFGYTPQELNEIPVHVVERDLYFLSREAWAREILKDN